MTGVIPVMQYGNLSPTIEVEADSHEEAMELALKRFQDVWNRTAEKPLDIDKDKAPKIAATAITKRCRVSGAIVYFDPVAHTYTDADGKKYMGGSTFASKYKSPFAADVVAGKMATKHGVKKEDIRAMWSLNAEASSTFGTSVHAALQLYGEYLELSKAIKDGSDESALTSNPVLRPIVEKFFTDERKAETAFYEEFVADAKNHRCGLIDRLVVDSDGLWVEDFKSNATVTDKTETILAPFKGLVPNNPLGVYWLQLSYYSAILQAHGRTVKGLRVHHWTGTEWVTYENEVIDLSPAFKEKAS